MRPEDREDVGAESAGLLTIVIRRMTAAKVDIRGEVFHPAQVYGLQTCTVPEGGCAGASGKSVHQGITFVHRDS